MSEIQPLPQFPPQRAPQHDQQREQQRMGERMDDSCDDMPTVPIPARKVVTTFDAASRHERLEVKPPLTRLFRRTITKAFSVWLKFSTALVRSLDWYPRVEPYVGYGTEHYSRLICRTVYGPFKRQAGRLIRGIRGMLMVPSPHTKVRIAIDDVPIETVQVGASEVYDAIDSNPDISSEFAASDDAGYLDLVAEHSLEPGIHNVSYKVRSRKPVNANLFTIPSGTKVGVISDVDDTIMVTQAPRLMKAAYNLLLLNPRKKVPVASMNLLFNRIADMFPDAPFFYLSTSPWNVESSIRHFITNHGFPEGPLLLRDLDPRPKTFIPSGVQHKSRIRRTAHGRFSRYEVHSDRRRRAEGSDHIRHDRTPLSGPRAGDLHPPADAARGGGQHRFRCGAREHAADAGHRRTGVHGSDRVEHHENHAAVPARHPSRGWQERLTGPESGSMHGCTVRLPEASAHIAVGKLGGAGRYNRVHE